VILSDLLAKVEKRPGRKRLGRGRGSGHGKTCGRGHKGAASRSGYSRNLAFEGGQVTLIRHLPKRGFSNALFRKRYDVVNLDVLEKHFGEGEAVRLDVLVERGLLKVEHGRLKILGQGSVSKNLSVVVHAISESARQKIEAAGGSVEILAGTSKNRSQ
jgi:large subunit ribosomal protein L15